MFLEDIVRATFSRAGRNRAAPIIGLVLVAFLVACAHQPELPHIGHVPGFLYGLWHGLIAPFAFVGSLFTDVRMYAFPNSGPWYDFGFLLGLAAWGGGGAAARR